MVKEIASIPSLPIAIEVEDIMRRSHETLRRQDDCDVDDYDDCYTSSTTSAIPPPKPVSASEAIQVRVQLNEQTPPPKRSAPNPPPTELGATTSLSTKSTTSIVQSIRTSSVALTKSSTTSTLFFSFQVTISQTTISQSTITSFPVSQLQTTTSHISTDTSGSLSTNLAASSSSFSASTSHPSTAAQGISSNTDSPRQQAEIIVPSLVGAAIVLIGLMFLLRRYARRRRTSSDGKLGSLRPSFPFYTRTVPVPVSSTHITDMEQALPGLPYTISSEANSSTINTTEIFTGSPLSPPSFWYPGLFNHPTNQSIKQVDGSVKIIIQPQPYGRATLVNLKKKPRIITTDLYIGENKRDSIFLRSEWPKTLKGPNQVAPLKFDMMEKSEQGSSVKKASATLEQNPAGRWSYPFTMAWGGSGAADEADEGATRRMSTLSWMKELTGKWEGWKRKEKEKGGTSQVGV